MVKNFAHVRTFKVGESFRPPFSKGGTDPTPWGVGRPPQRAKLPKRRFSFDNFSLCACGVKEKSGYGG